MFGNELSETTISKTCEILKRDRESIENCNVNTLRFEVEELYDISHAYVFSSAIAGDEQHLDKGGILI